MFSVFFSINPFFACDEKKTSTLYAFDAKNPTVPGHDSLKTLGSGRGGQLSPVEIGRKNSHDFQRQVS